MNREKHEKMCPECGETVWMFWDESPNLKCASCGIEGDYEQCCHCESLVPKWRDYCHACQTQMMED